MFLARELDVLELQNKIHSQVQTEVDKNQREYFLREQLKAIQKELGEADAQGREIVKLREKLDAAGLPEEVRTKADEELERLAVMPTMSPEVGMVRSYLEWLAGLPWSIATEDQLDIDRAAQVLDQHHYGLQRVKERILEYMAVRKLAADRMRSPVLCFVGPPGVGKTSLGKAIAQAIGRKFVRVSLGGVRDEAEIRGHRRTYIGALPGPGPPDDADGGDRQPGLHAGRDRQARLGLPGRPVGGAAGGARPGAELRLLGPLPRRAVQPVQGDVRHDRQHPRSGAAGPARPDGSDRAARLRRGREVRDRPAVPGAAPDERARPDQHRSSASPRQALRHIIREYTHEAGVRNLERQISTICRKVARKVATGDTRRTTVSLRNLDELLGPPRVHPQPGRGARRDRDRDGRRPGRPPAAT